MAPLRVVLWILICLGFAVIARVASAQPPAAVDGAGAAGADTARAPVRDGTADLRASVRVEHVPSLELQGPPSAGWTSKDWVTLGSSVLVPLVGFLGLVVGLYNAAAALKMTRQSMLQQANALELKELDAKLDGFYGPFMQLSDTNRTLALELKARHRERSSAFRTLIALVDDAQRGALEDNDKAIIAEIVRIGTALRKLIEAQAGMLDERVQPYLWRANAHFRIIRLAHMGRLKGDVARFRDYVYPEMLDEVLRREVRRLRDRKEVLRSEPSRQHPPMPSLDVSDLPLAAWPPNEKGSATDGAGASG